MHGESESGIGLGIGSGRERSEAFELGVGDLEGGGREGDISIHCGVMRSRSFMLRKVNDEQKTGIRKTEHDLQVAEEEMVKEKFGISSIFEDLTEVHGGWLPHTFGVHVDYFQTYIVTYWNELGRPAFNLGIEKALKMKAHGEDWAGIINWIPRLKKQFLEFKAYLEPNI
ncbi:hypothetical protein ACFX2I_001562 [Malus domestica]